ncbi:kelch domain-containing protein 9 [Spea bombifrons]|uniref:kelch domain-containing protein 9 n=1 Tax=Spea bombifrons TaxID=233779 RepID=UPI00234AC897|nr:kelch domain-containing protein 9 [Spea bombifrons]
MTSTECPWTWNVVAQDERFARGYHTCTAIRGKLYVSGGVRSTDPKEAPLGDVVVFDTEQKTARGMAPENAFKRSHHDAVELGNRWLCVVGGWDGSRRVSSVFSYDTEREEWALWAEGPTNNPPVGLSSHTCTKISDHELRVVGREGGLRTQRRYASVYTLRVNASTKTYWYREEESRTASRSGHSAVLLPSDSTSTKTTGYSLYVFGGRESSSVDFAGQWSKDKIQVNTVGCPKLTEQLSRLVSTEGVTRDAPKSLKHHSSSVVGPFVVVFGGEALSKSRDAVCNDLYVFDTRCSPPSWYHFPGSDRRLKRVGHRTCLINDRLYLVGGFGADGKTPCPEVCVLDFAQ